MAALPQHWNDGQFGEFSGWCMIVQLFGFLRVANVSTRPKYGKGSELLNGPVWL